jgi:hypothetical protein
MNGSRRVTKHQLHGDSADRVRSISLRELLPWHGFEIKPEGVTYRAKKERYNIVVTGNRWFDNTRPESEKSGRLTFRCT